MTSEEECLRLAKALKTLIVKERSSAENVAAFLAKIDDDAAAVVNHGNVNNKTAMHFTAQVFTNTYLKNDIYPLHIHVIIYAVSDVIRRLVCSRCWSDTEVVSMNARHGVTRQCFSLQAEVETQLWNTC